LFLTPGIFTTGGKKKIIIIIIIIILLTLETFTTESIKNKIIITILIGKVIWIRHIQDVSEI